MPLDSHFPKSVAICAIAALLSACTGSQVQTTPFAGSSQNLQSAVVASHGTGACPIVGKTYTISEPPGTISAKFANGYVRSKSTKSFAMTLVFSNWPANRTVGSLRLWSTSCGPGAGKNPGDISLDTGGGSYSQECHNNDCTIKLNMNVKVITYEMKYKSFKFALIEIGRAVGSPSSVPLFRLTMKR